MAKLIITQLQAPCRDANIRIPLHGAEIIRMQVEMKSNQDILDYMHKNYGTEWKGTSITIKAVVKLNFYCFEHNKIIDILNKFE